MVNDKKGDYLVVKIKGFRASDCFLKYHLCLPHGKSLNLSSHFMSDKIFSPHLMIVSKNENTYLKYVARCLAHKCATTVIIGNHISCNFRPLPVLLPGGNGQGKGNVRYIFL